MTKLINNPAEFTEDMLAGFIDAYGHLVTAIPGGVVRRTATPQGKVATVVGGGSGHYPAFAGVVGHGFADGAVVGNVFTSPSAAEAYSVAREAASDAGVLIMSGNYAGDVMNFTMAAKQLVEEGIDARVLFVTDDIASAEAAAATSRRGVAGDFVVFRIAGAAADQGYDLDAVETVARRANEHTRTLGVAFAGCTLPGATEPLFTVPDGQMAVGLGIHGEPGITEAELPTAAGLAERLVNAVAAELSADWGSRVTVVLNGLGSTKYEELFVLWGRVAPLLRDRGYEIVEPEVGELVTSLDMAGVSLTVTVLDDELETLWRSGTLTPAYSKRPESAAASGEDRDVRRREINAAGETDASHEPTVEATAASRAVAGLVMTALRGVATELNAQAERLGRIDAVAGDGDHGRGMLKGITAAVAAAQDVNSRSGGVGSLLDAAGAAWAARAGGTSGVLWGAALQAAGALLGDTADEYEANDAADAVAAAIARMQALGGAKIGDKTMLDAAIPFHEALVRQLADHNLPSAWEQAAGVASQAAEETANLRPRLGRARPLAERSLGTPDAGAISFAMCVTRAHAETAAASH